MRNLKLGFGRIPQPRWVFLLLVALLGTGIPVSFAAVSSGEVFLRDGVWIATVNGEEFHEGERMFDAVNAACEQAGPGATINIRDSGESGPNPVEGVYAIRPLEHQTLDFHGNTVLCNGGDLVVAVANDRQDGITVLNLRVTGNPRYGLWFRGCNDLTLDNITIEHTGESPVGLGIRVASMSTGRDSPDRVSGLRIGTVTVSGTRTHAVETFSVDNIRIDRVNASDIPLGSGLQINDGRDVWIRSVYGERVATESTYATVRFANVTRGARIDYIHSRGSARGFYNMGNVIGARVGYVDIADSRVSGVSIHSGASDVQVFDGVVIDSNNDVDIWDGATEVCIRVNGTAFGDACDMVTGETVAEGVYQLVARHSGKVMEAPAGGEALRQAAETASDSQKWRVVAAGGNRFRLQNLASGRWLTDDPEKGLRLDHENDTRWKDFTFIPTMGGEYRIVPSATGGTVEVGDASAEGGALVRSGAYQGASHQQWRLNRLENDH